MNTITLLFGLALYVGGIYVGRNWEKFTKE